VAFNLRNTTVDKRRLSKADKEAYRPRTRMAQMKKTSQLRGNMAWENNKPIRTQSRREGTGGFTGGLAIQQERMRRIGADLERSRQLKAEGTYMPSLTQGMFN